NTLGFMYLHETYEQSAQGSSTDVVSGATTAIGGGTAAFEEDRDEIGAYITHKLKDTTLGAGYYYGDEPDYISHTLVLAADQDLLDKNLTLSARVMFSQDEVDKLDAEPDESFPKDKDVNRLVLAATQLLSPHSLMVGGFALEDQEGYLSSPTRRIRILTPIGDGFNELDIVERHPDERLRQVYFLRGKHYFMTRSAFDLNLSYYTDDWGVDAKSAEARLSHYLTSKLIGRLRYRYYSQSEAEFYKETYTVEEDIMTADYKLREFDSSLYGIKFTYFPRFKQFDDMSVSISYDIYEETNNGVDADIIQLWLVMPF
ncbi:MAG: DUF3570 domain-containing protein, partial [Gammaproteobacteria bacterium]|nr:DUF3570 domain-containing protein [Gammaproteobacteria bacterium]